MSSGGNSLSRHAPLDLDTFHLHKIPIPGLRVGLHTQLEVLEAKVEGRARRSVGLVRALERAQQGRV